MPPSEKESLTQVCVPLTSSKPEGLIEEGLFAKKMCGDILEWRADSFYTTDIETIVETLKKLSSVCELPIIFTWRSSRDGGKEILDADYSQLIKAVADSKLASYIDIEYSYHGAKQLVDYTEEKGNKVILSYHDFNGYPNLEELRLLVEKMGGTGGSIIKIAFTPNDISQVLQALYLEASYNKEIPHPALVTISMGEIGKLSRVTGNLTGAPITFASAINSSAPGQLTICQTKAMMDIFKK